MISPSIRLIVISTWALGVLLYCSLTRFLSDWLPDVYVNIRDNSAQKILWKPSRLMCHGVELLKLDVLVDQLGLLVIEMLFK